MNNKRLDFLKKTYSVISIDSYMSFLDEDETIQYFDIQLENDTTNNKKIIAVRTDEEGLWRITQEAFDLFVECDPTIKKIYVQWFLNLTLRYIKLGLMDNLKRLISEDLLIIQDSLLRFDQLKKTKRFKELTKKVHSLKALKDTSDINQYSHIEQLHDAIFIFEPNNTQGLFKRLEILANNKSGEIPFEDKNFIVFTPLTLKASIEFNGIGRWCTTRPGNGMFRSYTSKLNGMGKKSKLFIIINKNIDFTTSEDDTEDDIKHRKNGIFQIHFESGQINNQTNYNDPESFLKYFLNKSYGLTVFFKEVLSTYLKGANSRGLVTYYSSALKNLDFIDVLINILPDNSPIIDIDNVKAIGDLEIKIFNNLKILKLTKMGLTHIPIMTFPKSLEIISLQNNKLQEIPEILAELKNLKSLNLSYNNINTLPVFLSKMDPLNGGSLINLSLRGNPIDLKDKEKLYSLLPSVNIVF